LASGKAFAKLWAITWQGNEADGANTEFRNRVAEPDPGGRTSAVEPSNARMTAQLGRLAGS